MNKKAAFHNLGCKVNAYETEAMMENLKSHGYEIVPFQPGADVYVINTCTVTNIADRKSRQMLHRAKEMNPEAVVVAVGCYVQDAKETLEKDEAVDLIIGNSEKSKLNEILEAHFAGNEAVSFVDSIASIQEYEALNVSQTEGRTRAFIKIQDGCNQFCSYCMIPYVRGRVRSRKKEEILNEAERLRDRGYHEIVLTGIHISSYGIDFDAPGQNLQTPDAKEAKTNRHLLELIQELAEIDGITRIRLGSLEPGIMTEEFVRGIAAVEKICPQFHLSLQSGCDSTLKRMKRKYDTASYRSIVALLRTHFEHPAITTDIITGFPGETEEEFAETEAFVRDIQFAQTHIFKYSVRRGTAAAAMKNQNTDTVKHQRSSVLLEIDAGMRRSFAEYYLGKTVNVLFEEPKMIDGTEYLVGHTKEYLEACLPMPEHPETFEGVEQNVTVMSVDAGGRILTSLNSCK